MTEETNVNEETYVEKPSLLGMIMSPGVQFERIRKNPKILVAFIIVTLLTVLGMFMMTQGVDYTNIPEFSGMDEDELMIMTIGTQIGVIVSGLFTPIISILVSAAIYLVIAMIAKRDVTFKQLFSMNTYIFVISTLSVLVNGLAMMLTAGGVDTEILFTSINSIVGAEGVLGAFLNTLEVFTIWGMIITAIGLQIVAKFSKVLSWSVILVIYVITTGFSMVAAGVTSMVGI